MRVAEVSAFGGPEVFRVADRPEPEPGPGEVVVRIHATAINPTDLGTRAGQARRRLPDLEPPFVPGWDLAGELADTGERVVGMIPFVAIGGRVGAYAEAAAVDPDWLAPLDASVSFEVGATLPLNALTANEALERLGLAPGSRLLVTGASGAVGGFATQLGAAAGLEVVAVASDGDEDWVAGNGAAEVLPRDADLSAIDPVDGVFDAVPLGPDVSTGGLRDGGPSLFTRPPGDTFLVSPNQPALAALSRKLAAGELRTRVAKVLPLDQVAEGHRLAEAGGLRGKVVLAIR
jgi:NADPH:quinone reductase-like Zn-dependent oxidoreductase